MKLVFMFVLQIWSSRLQGLIIYYINYRELQTHIIMLAYELYYCKVIHQLHTNHIIIMCLQYQTCNVLSLLLL